MFSQAIDIGIADKMRLERDLSGESEGRSLGRREFRPVAV
jgi:hypothetical protein